MVECSSCDYDQKPLIYQGRELHFRLTDSLGNSIGGHWALECGRLIRAGAIVAVKGLGGFHLACDATQKEVVIRLRQRKNRPARPLAVMCRDLATVKQYCHVSPGEEALLISPQAPIVLLTRLANNNLPVELSPGVTSLGVMLPYTPWHEILLHHTVPVLVMTSGNSSGLPLVKDNDRACAELGGIADYFLMHDHDILQRCDDSVVAVNSGGTHFLRRSRGYAVMPVQVPAGDGPVVLGSGGEMKNTFCLLSGGKAHLSQHMGDIFTLEARENYLRVLEHTCAELGLTPTILAPDPHPDYQITKLAASIPWAERIDVQHHHAHMASCMAENGLEQPVIGLIMDGTGYGLDGNIWGFEILTGTYTSFRRVCHLDYFPLPGGERAVQNPWICAVGCLIHYLGETGSKAALNLFPEHAAEIKVLAQMMAKKINSPLASSCGRLFDAVSAILGICSVNCYDGQAAIELGEKVFAAKGEYISPYPFSINQDVINPGAMLEAILSDLQAGVSVPIIACRFHATMAAMLVAGAEIASDRTGIKDVVLSGGCWHNSYLFTITRYSLQHRGFKVHYHRLVPPGDGGISLGQAMVGYMRWRKQKTPAT